jgi:guanylate cyclase
MAPIEMVNLLNQIFSFFDSLVEKFDVEKIRTIGDSYMVASGVPRLRSDHAHALAYMSLEMRDYVCSLPLVEGRPIQFRIGINSGPVVGGVIGQKKFVYDLWGDPVNIASRMESHGVAGKIQVAQATYELIQADFICEARGMIDVKGRGEMATWFLEGVREGAAQRGTTASGR